MNDFNRFIEVTLALPLFNDLDQRSNLVDQGHSYQWNTDFFWMYR